MSKFKRYIKNVFSIAGLEWRKAENFPTKEAGVLVSNMKTDTASQRSRIADEQFMMNVEEFARVIQSLLPGESYETEYPDGVVDKDVGNIPAGTPYSDLHPSTFNDLFDRIFFVSPPVIILDGGDAVIISIPVEPIVEVGETIHFEGTAIHTRGAIDSPGPPPTVELRGDATLFTFIDQTGSYPTPAVTNSQAFIGTDFQAIQGNNTLQCQIDWEQGVGAYFDEAGNEMHSYDTLRAAGSATPVDAVIGAYNAWFGSGILGSTPIDSATARALGSTFLDNTGYKGQILYTIPAGDVEFYFSVPTGSEVVALHFKQNNIYLTPQFVMTSFDINDAAGNPIPYDTYSLVIGGIGYEIDAEMIIDINPNAV